MRYNLYKIMVKNQEVDNYAGFMVASHSIPDALEIIYEYVCMKDGKVVRDIPYVLRSSNMDIKCLGEFVPTTPLASAILMIDYYSA